MSSDTQASRQRRFRNSLGPIADLEAHLPEDWWREMFDALYLMTDGDVVENESATTQEVDNLIAAFGLEPESRILDLCCGQGRHTLELASRGYTQLTGIDRSRYLIRLAKKRAKEGGFAVTFKEGDARNIRLPEESQDYVMILGNSFGYFASACDDAQVLDSVAKILTPTGCLVLDITDGDWMSEHYERRSWEWIDEHHFVCRERNIASDGERLVSREVIVNDEQGVIADQFYAERLYSRGSISSLLRDRGFSEIRLQGSIEGQSDRDQDLGMMGRRILLSAVAPVRRLRSKSTRNAKPLDVAVVLGDPRLPDPVKLHGKFNEQDIETVDRLKEALANLPAYRFTYYDNHPTLLRDLNASGADLVFNLCDEGWDNDAFKELHVPALLEMHGYDYTGAGPACLGACYDKGLVRAVAQAMDIPVPMETFIRAGDQSATLPSTFPAILKPNFGDSSFGITKDAVVRSSAQVLNYLEKLRTTVGDKPVLVQEFLSGNEYTVALVGNPRTGLSPLPTLEVDYSGLGKGLPPILGYESKWDPDSPYWTQIQYKPAILSDGDQRSLIDWSTMLFERLGCRDYARFDFRADTSGVIKLLEANPNPGWCWDGKVNFMAGYAGWTYADLLHRILVAAIERVQSRDEFLGVSDQPKLAVAV